MFARNLLIYCFLSFSMLHPLTAQDSGSFKVVVSGQLAPKLDRGTKLFFWRPAEESTPDSTRTFAVSDLPATLPFDQFSNSPWHVEFISPAAKKSLFSVTLAKSLFDKPRKIDIKLDPPKPQLRPHLDNWRKPVYTANISQRMYYRELPFWDSKQNRLAPSPNVPTLSIYDLDQARRIHRSRMYKHSCHFIWPQQWYGKVDDINPKRKTELRFRVRYDSGGLFETFETAFPFTFHPQLHSN